MGLKEQLQRKIDQRQLEVRDLQAKIREAEIYIQAWQETIRILPKEANGQAVPEQTLRKGSNIYQAREAIRTAGRPLHIAELLKAIGLPVDKNNRASLAGSMSTYVRRGDIFTKPEPNTFGLIEKNRPTTEPPENFGLPEDREVTDDDIPF